MDHDRDAEEDDVPSQGIDIRAKLKQIIHYASLGFAPVVSIVALVIAILAPGDRADQTQLGELKSNIDFMNLGVLGSRSELENIKLSILREKSIRRKADEIDARIIQNVTQLQKKLKITPTLEEQLRAAAKAAAVAAQTEDPAAAASAPVVSGKQQTAPAPAPASMGKMSATAPVPKEMAKKTVPAETAIKAVPEESDRKPSPKAVPKLSPQVKAIKDAIDEYNRQ